MALFNRLIRITGIIRKPADFRIMEPGYTKLDHFFFWAIYRGRLQPPRAARAEAPGQRAGPPPLPLLSRRGGWPAAWPEGGGSGRPDVQHRRRGCAGHHFRDLTQMVCLPPRPPASRAPLIFSRARKSGTPPLTPSPVGGEKQSRGTGPEMALPPSDYGLSSTGSFSRYSLSRWALLAWAARIPASRARGLRGHHSQGGPSGCSTPGQSAQQLAAIRWICCQSMALRRRTT